ncbi:MAG: M28 family peptidase, partial [Actinomycetota bacterium]|nr:M28 family peptidase [Actinomycetota bacterium]
HSDASTRGYPITGPMIITPTKRLVGGAGLTSGTVLNARIYRTGLIPVAMAVIVFAFSLGHTDGPLATTLVPDAFNPSGQGNPAYTTMLSLAKRYPVRLPGSEPDNQLAKQIASQLAQHRFVVSTQRFRANTALGPGTLENVTGVFSGGSSGAIVVVAHRDSLRSPSVADLSGTAVLLQLANVLSGQTPSRSVVLASTSGSAGGAGAAELARDLPGPVDAVIVLGDLAGATVRQPVIVPWSNAGVASPALLRSTLAAALASQAQIGPGQTSFAGQFMHLAFPLATSEQASFGASGESAALLSVAGDRAASATEPVSATAINALGRTVLQTITALDGGPQIPAPSAYLLYAGNVVPSWAVSLLVLALILPVLGATIDGLARARRRGHWVLRWAVWVLSGALPFAVAALVVVAAGQVGLIGVATPGPVAGGVPMHGVGAAVLIVAGGIVAGGFLLVRPRIVSFVGLDPRNTSQDVGGEGATAALMTVLCGVALAVWAANPFAAALLVPAIHLWMWAVAPEVRPPRAAVALMALAGLALPALATVYCAEALGVGPIGLIWSFTTLLASGTIGVLSALEMSILIGCAVSFALIAVAKARQPRITQVPVTVRGPISYAGPGSLGGTESALRR